MKKTIITVIITFLATSAVWYVVTDLRHAVYVVRLRSAVKVPGQMAINTIRDDLQAGRHETAKARLEVLRASWARFIAEEGRVQNGIGNIMAELGDMPMPTETRMGPNHSLHRTP